MPAVRQYVNPSPRLVCTVRPVADVLCSYIRLCEANPDNNFIDNHLRADDTPITNEHRASVAWSHYLHHPYKLLQKGLREFRDYHLLIDYQALVDHPQEQLERVYEFCDLDDYQHQFHGITNTCAEANDAAWGAKGMHDIRSNVGRTSPPPEAYLSRESINYFSQFDVR